MTEGKGRPTPKRSEAQQRRVAVTKPPASRKDAKRQLREQSRAKRAAAQAALRTGDERNYPEFFRGPEKASVRDAVDGRRSLGWLALPAFLLNIASFAAPTIALKNTIAIVSMAVMLVVVTDAALTVRTVRRALGERFPDGTKESRGSLVRYGVARNLQRRSRRTPPPRVRSPRPGTNET